MLQGINFVAVVVTAVITMVIGGLWYSVIFGKQWMALAGIKMTEKDKAEMKKKAGPAYLMGFVVALVSSFVLALVITLANAVTILDGVLVGVLVWFGFVATVHIGSVLWERKSWKLFFINTMYSLVTLVISGAILAVWA